MKELLAKISSYNIFNYLFPGILFVVILREITAYDLVLENNLIGAFLYYFIGLVISRFGSLVIEPILKVLRFIKFADYNDYMDAKDKDEDIVLFSEINNMYRTLIAVLILLLLAYYYESIAEYNSIPNETSFILLVFSLLILFIFSYRKQTAFIVKRVAKHSNFKKVTKIKNKKKKK